MQVNFRLLQLASDEYGSERLAVSESAPKPGAAHAGLLDLSPSRAAASFPCRRRAHGITFPSRRGLSRSLVPRPVSRRRRRRPTDRPNVHGSNHAVHAVHMHQRRLAPAGSLALSSTAPAECRPCLSEELSEWPPFFSQRAAQTTGPLAFHAQGRCHIELCCAYSFAIPRAARHPDLWVSTTTARWVGKE